MLAYNVEKLACPSGKFARPYGPSSLCPVYSIWSKACFPPQKQNVAYSVIKIVISFSQEVPITITHNDYQENNDHQPI